jgi:hypothetical protein
VGCSAFGALFKPAQFLSTALEQESNPPGKLVRLPAQAIAGDSDHLDAGELQVLLSFSIVLERGSGSVCIPSVELDRESLFFPVQVDLVTLDEIVYGGLWQARPTQKTQKLALAAGACKGGSAIDIHRLLQSTSAGVAPHVIQEAVDRGQIEQVAAIGSIKGGFEASNAGR